MTNPIPRPSVFVREDCIVATHRGISGYGNTTGEAIENFNDAWIEHEASDHSIWPRERFQQ